MTDTSTPGAKTYARHRLAWLDQLAYEMFRATGRSQLMQCLWLYERDLNMAALEETFERLVALSFNRVIEPSPLPWGRPRWVRPAGEPVPLEQGATVLPKSQLLHWANEQARLPINPVTGPAWRMAIQRFDDGTTAVSFAGSHLVLDGMGALRAIEVAANRIEVPGSYMTQGTRGWLAGCLSDARQILADAPRSLSALVRIALASWRKPTATQQKQAAAPTGSSADKAIVVDLPSIAVTIDAQVWDACAQRLGGRAITLLPAFVAALAAKLGRRRSSDGAINLLVPVDRRTGLDDERALAIEFRTMIVPPEGLSTDLRPVNAPMKALLRGARESGTDALAPLLPAISWMPRTVAMAIVNQVFTYADERPVSCSNLGTLPEAITRVDGEPCTRFVTRAVDVNVTRHDLERSHGHLVVVASRVDKTMSLCIEAYQQETALVTTEALEQITAQTLADFGLDATIDT